MKLKVCGMNHNIAEVAAIRPDYLGFIFWDKSSRFFDGEIPTLPEAIKKVGVFVDADLEYIKEQVKKFSLQGIQLHGKENPEYCMELKESFPSFRAQSRKMKTTSFEEKEVSIAPDQKTSAQVPKIIKVFSVKEGFDFGILEGYEEVCDYFLFDTKGALPGGNGYTFDWAVLKNYPSTKPYFLSGGIGPESIEDIHNFLKGPESAYCHALDVNSRFEERPGLKKIEKLKHFKAALSI